MEWSSLFLVILVQGVFLITVTAYRGSKNVLASRLMIALVVMIIFPNFGYLVMRTGLKEILPQLSGLHYGMFFLVGPLIYFYSKSVLDNSFRWRHVYWLHFIPYVVYLASFVPVLLLPKEIWVDFIDTFLSGNLSIRLTEKIVLGLQLLHLLIYLISTSRWLNGTRNISNEPRYLIPFESRIKWVKQFYICLALIFVTVLALYTFVLISGRFNPVTNYIYTIILSGIVFFVAYKLVLNPEPLSPDFTTKYSAYMQFDGAEGEKYVQRLKSLMEQSKVFLNPELNLPILSEKIGLPSHQVSKLVNEKFDKSYNDFVNEYRVKEFLTRINDPDYQSLSIYGLALEVGFNSKSSFNTAFKKVTGKTPSEFRTNGNS